MESVNQSVRKMFLYPATKYALPLTQVTWLSVVWRLLFVRDLEGGGRDLLLSRHLAGGTEENKTKYPSRDRRSPCRTVALTCSAPRTT